MIFKKRMTLKLQQDFIVSIKNTIMSYKVNDIEFIMRCKIKNALYYIVLSYIFKHYFMEKKQTVAPKRFQRNKK